MCMGKSCCLMAEERINNHYKQMPGIEVSGIFVPRRGDFKKDIL